MFLRNHSRSHNTQNNRYSPLIQQSQSQNQTQSETQTQSFQNYSRCKSLISDSKLKRNKIRQETQNFKSVSDPEHSENIPSPVSSDCSDSLLLYDKSSLGPKKKSSVSDRSDFFPFDLLNFFKLQGEMTYHFLLFY